MSTDDSRTTRVRAGELLDRLLALPVRIEHVDTTACSSVVGGGFRRVTTVVELAGAGTSGRGEDVAYDATAHEQVPEVLGRLGLAGDWTLGSLSDHLAQADLSVPGRAGWDDKVAYHWWAIEGAALDLALRQAQRSLADVAGTSWSDVTFSLSMGLGKPPASDAVDRWLAASPGTTFKLDTSAGWTRDLVRRLAATRAVRVVDFKGLYQGDWADNDPDPELYAAVAADLPEALLEDALLTDETQRALGAAGLRRLAWDFPITRPEDVEALDHPPAAINIKPSRFGSLRRLLETIDLCQRRGIPMYAGGQSELSVGRTQVQQLASLFFPDAPNDIAPVVYHRAQPGDEVPASPMRIPDGHGFGFDPRGA